MAIMRTLRSTAKENAKPSKPRPPETPVHTRHAMKAFFQISDPNEKKMAVYQDMSPCLEKVDPLYFFTKILPPIKQGIDADKVIKTLKKDGVIVDGRFECFPQNPSKLPGLENDVFKNLESLVSAIVDAAKNSKVEPTMFFRCNPNGVPESEHRTNFSRPDGYVLVVDPGTGRVQWVSVALASEYKKKLDKAKKHDVRAHLFRNLSLH